MRNFRFDTRINGDCVTLTVKPEHTRQRPLVWSRFSRHDEGWSKEARAYWQEDGELYATFFDDGMDCDGRLTRVNDCKWLYMITQNFGRRVVRWQSLELSQRDYYAEKMNY